MRNTTIIRKRKDTEKNKSQRTKDRWKKEEEAETEEKVAGSERGEGEA